MLNRRVPGRKNKDDYFCTQILLVCFIFVRSCRNTNSTEPGLRIVHVVTFQLDNIAGILLQNSRGMMFDKTGQHFIAVKPRYGKTFERYLFAL